MEAFVEESGGVFESLRQTCPSQLSSLSPIWVSPFKSKDRLACRM